MSTETKAEKFAALAAAMIDIMNGAPSAPAGVFVDAPRKTSPASKIDLASQIRDAIGSHLAQIAQGARLIQGDAEARMYEPRSAIELAAELEEVRERCAIAYALIEQALERINEAHGTASYTASPLERAQGAMRGAA